MPLPMCTIIPWNRYERSISQWPKFVGNFSTLMIKVHDGVFKTLFLADLNVKNNPKCTVFKRYVMSNHSAYNACRPCMFIFMATVSKVFCCSSYKIYQIQVSIIYWGWWQYVISKFHSLHTSHMVCSRHFGRSEVMHISALHSLNGPRPPTKKGYYRHINPHFGQAGQCGI